MSPWEVQDSFLKMPFHMNKTFNLITVYGISLCSFGLLMRRIFDPNMV